MGLLGTISSALGNVAGVMSPIGTIAGGVSALGSLFGRSPESKAMELAKLQHQWDVEENQKNRDFQRDEWTRQFDAINAYNDPSATRDRLIKAGVNATAMLNGSGATVGNSSASPSAPSGAHGLNPLPDVVSQVGFQSRESLMKRLQILGDMAKTSNLLPETKAKLSAEIQSTLADERFKSVRADSEKFMLELSRFFDPIMKRAGVAQAFKNLALTDAETRLAVANGEVANEEKLNKAEERLLTIAKRNLSQKDFEKLQLEIKWFDSEHKQAIEESKSRTASNYASAEESRQRALTESQLRESRKLAIDLSNELQGLENDFNYETYQKRLENFASQVGIVKWSLLTSEMEYKDRNAYNALQRLMLGKGSRKDGLDVMSFLRNHSTDKFDLSK